MFKLIVVFVGLGIGLLSGLLIGRRVKSLPEVRDSIFVTKFKEVYGNAPSEAVLQERDDLARQLGIQCQKLDTSYTFEELSKHLDDSFGSYQLVIGDLESTVSELFEKLGVRKPYASPSTIGELIYEIIRAKKCEGS